MQDMNAWLEPSYGGMHCCILHLALEATANIYITNREIFFYLHGQRDVSTRRLINLKVDWEEKVCLQGFRQRQQHF